MDHLQTGRGYVEDETPRKNQKKAKKYFSSVVQEDGHDDKKQQQKQKMDKKGMRKQIHLWLRGDLMIRGLLPLAPPSRLVASNLKKMVGYAKSKHQYPNLSYEIWKHIACDKLIIEKNICWVYFSTFLDIWQGREERQKEENFSSTTTGADEEDKTRDRLSVPLMQFVLFLYLQCLNRTDLSDPLRTGDVFPNSPRNRSLQLSNSPNISSSAASSDPSVARKMESNSGEQRFLEFIRNNIDKMLGILEVAEAHGDYHDTPSRFVNALNLEKLEPLNLFLEGEICTSDHIVPSRSENVPISFTDLISGEEVIERTAGNKLDIDVLAKLIRERLSPDPFFLVSCVPFTKNRPFSSSPVPVSSTENLTDNQKGTKPYLGKTDSPVDHRVTLASDINRQAVIKDADVIHGTYLKIMDCRSSELYFLCPLRCTTVENCKKCTVVVGPTEHIVRVQNCAGCKVVALCQRLIVSECRECTFHVKCAREPLILGGANHDLTFGPYNTWYRFLEERMKSVGLKEKPDLWDKPLAFLSGNSKANQTCGTTMFSPDSGIMDFKLSWHLLPPSEFHLFCIPAVLEGDGNEFQEEKRYLGSLPFEYRENLEKRDKFVEELEKKKEEFPAEIRKKLEAELERKFEEFLVKSGLDRELKHLEVLRRRKK